MDSVNGIARALMLAIARSGVLRGPNDCELAARVMRDELKEFLTGARYAGERALIKDTPSGHNLAWSSLVIHTIERISRERQGATN